MGTEKRLTQGQLKGLLQEPGMHNDGGSLYLVVRRPGSAAWVFKRRSGGNLRSHGLGAYPAVSLADAREKRDALTKRPALPSTASLSFAVAANRYIDNHASDYSDAQATRLRALVRLHAGQLARVRVDQIRVEQVADVLRPIWNGTTNSKGAKLRSLIERVIDAADLDRNPAAWRRLKSHLPGRARPVVPVASLPWASVPAAMAELALDDSIAATALRFLVLTGLRLKEGCGVKWSEIDFVRRVLMVPASRMKIKTAGEFTVPMSREAIGLLRRLHNQRGEGDFVFPGRLGGYIGRHAMHNAVGRLELGVTIHGFRSSLATWAQEQMRGGVRLFDQALIDACLAHFVGGTSGAYQRSELLAARRRLMDRWGRFALSVGITTM
jgi:integrase